MEAKSKDLRELFRSPIPYLVVISLAIIAVAIASYLRWGKGWDWAEWTGLGETVKVIVVTPPPGVTTPIPPIVEYYPAKTFWDWLVFLVGALVAVFGYFYVQRLEERRKQTDLSIAADQQKEAALQAYFDKMTSLLLDKKHPLRKSKPEDEVRVVARTQTLTTLRALDPVRRGLLIQFLKEAGLIEVNGGEPIINMNQADLTGIVLNEANLIGVNLYRARLDEAKLIGAYLDGSYLGGASLVNSILAGSQMDSIGLDGADMGGANLLAASLIQADLTGVNLRRAVLSHAYLNGARLVNANLEGAKLYRADLTSCNLSCAKLSHAFLFGADLTGASLSGAVLSNADMTAASVTYEQLSEAASLADSIMPDGNKYDPENHKIFKEPPKN